MHSNTVLRTWMALATVLGLGGLTLALGVAWHLAFEGHSRPGLSVGRTDFDPALVFDAGLIALGVLLSAWGWMIARNVGRVRGYQFALPERAEI